MEVEVTVLPSQADARSDLPIQRATTVEKSPVAELSIICVNWNSLAYLRDCLRSIYANPPSVPFEIIVVDNASPEGGIRELVAEFPAVKVVESDVNLGFAGANNLGFKHSSGDKILLLNPDTEIVGPALDTLLRTMASLPDAGIVGCKLLNTDLSISTTSIQKFPTILNQVLSIERVRLMFPGCALWDIAPLFRDNPSPIRVDVIPGACMLLRRDVFERVGLLSEDYFMYAEDIDVNHKVRQLGYASYYTGRASVIHHGGKSSSTYNVSYWSTVMTYTAMLQYYRTTRGQAYAAVYRAAIGVAAIIRLVILALMLPVGDRRQIRNSSLKWVITLKWALGFEMQRTVHT